MRVHCALFSATLIVFAFCAHFYHLRIAFLRCGFCARATSSRMHTRMELFWRRCAFWPLRVRLLFCAWRVRARFCAWRRAHAAWYARCILRAAPALSHKTLVYQFCRGAHRAHFAHVRRAACARARAARGVVCMRALHFCTGGRDACARLTRFARVRHLAHRHFAFLCPLFLLTHRALPPNIHYYVCGSPIPFPSCCVMSVDLLCNFAACAVYYLLFFFFTLLHTTSLPWRTLHLRLSPPFFTCRFLLLCILLYLVDDFNFVVYASGDQGRMLFILLFIVCVCILFSCILPSIFLFGWFIYICLYVVVVLRVL